MKALLSPLSETSMPQGFTSFRPLLKPHHRPGVK